MFNLDLVEVKLKIYYLFHSEFYCLFRMYNIGSSKLDKSVRKKCASHHYLNTPNYYGVNNNYHDINSNKNTQALVTFTPLAKGFLSFF